MGFNLATFRSLNLRLCGPSKSEALAKRTWLEVVTEAYKDLPPAEREVMLKREYVIARVVASGEACYPANGNVFDRLCDRCGRGPCSGPVEKYQEENEYE